MDTSHSRLEELSELYSQRCLQLSHAEQRGKGRETELSHKERELEQLRRENQVLTHACFKVPRYGMQRLKSNISLVLRLERGWETFLTGCP